MSESHETQESSGGRHLWWWLIPLVLGCVSVLTIQVPPMLDWPLHLSQGVLLAQVNDPSIVPSQTYCVAPFAPYHLFHYTVRVLAVVVPAAWISQVTLLVLLLLYVASIALLLKAYRADIRLLMLAPPTFFGYSYIMGFAPNLLGLPFALASLGFAEYWWRTRSAKWAVGMTASLLLCYLCHPIPFFLALGCVGLRFLVDGRRSFRFLLHAGAWLLLPIAAAVQFLLYHKKLGVHQQQWFTAIYPNWSQNNQFGDSVFLRLKLLPSYVLGTEHLEVSLVLVSSLILLALVGLIFLPRWQTDESEEPTETSEESEEVDESKESTEQETDKPAFLEHVSLGTLVSIGVLWLGYLFLPDAFMKGNNVYARLIQFAVVFSLVLVPLVTSTTAQRLFLVMSLCACTFLGINWMYQYEWDRHFDNFHTVVKKLPKGSRYIGLLSQFKSAATLAQVYRGGEARYSFTHFFHMPLRDCNPKAQQATYDLRSSPWKFSPTKHGRLAPYILLYLEPNVRRNRSTFPWLFRKHPYRLVIKKGRWTLWKHHYLTMPTTKKPATPTPKRPQ